MQIELSKRLIENKNEWYFDGWRAVAKDTTSDELKKACEKHNKLVLEVVEIDEDI
ncbi:MAG: hypothetical protein IKV64_04060 [Clostridia bacterium]|nr:hypothetical protein [Clostridia bacterium]